MATSSNFTEKKDLIGISQCGGYSGGKNSEEVPVGVHIIRVT